MRAFRSAIRALPPVARRDAAIAELKEQRTRLRERVLSERVATQEAKEQAHAADVATSRAHEAESAAIQRAETAEVRIAETTAKLAGLEDQLRERARIPSWTYKLSEATRVRHMIRDAGVRDPIWQVNDKEAGYRLAQSHGYDIPAQLATYDDFTDIDWGGLPSEFVIKTVNGYGSYGVVPIVRDESSVTDLLNQRRGLISIDNVIAYLNWAHDKGRCSRDVVIEELLRSPFDRNRLAPDLKLYCFYGEVGSIMIRDVDGSRLSRHFKVRFLDAEGQDLGEAIPGRTTDPTLPAPLHLKEVIEAGQRLSAAVSTPFLRVDLYERSGGIVFGEVTPAPGGNQNFRPDLDRHFGDLWEQAEAKLRAEAVRAKAFQVRYGDR